MDLRTSLARVPLALLLLALQASAQDLPLYVASDPKAAPITAETVLENDRFWPYRVSITEAVAVPGGKRPLEPGLRGVMIGVSGRNQVRIDFGRDGKIEVPIRKTDLVERSNRVRTGEIEKFGPNLIASLGPRLVESGGPIMRQLDFATLGKPDAMVLVFADPTAPDFSALAQSLAPLQGRPDTLTILVPKGKHSDSLVREKLRESGWTIPFVFEHLAPGYIDAHLGAPAEGARVHLATAEGRMLLELSGNDDVGGKVRSEIEKRYGPQAPQTFSETGASLGGV